MFWGGLKWLPIQQPKKELWVTALEPTTPGSHGCQDKVIASVLEKRHWLCPLLFGGETSSTGEQRVAFQANVNQSVSAFWTLWASLAAGQIGWQPATSETYRVPTFLTSNLNHIELRAKISTSCSLSKSLSAGRSVRKGGADLTSESWDEQAFGDSSSVLSLYQSHTGGTRTPCDCSGPSPWGCLGAHCSEMHKHNFF